MQIQFLNGPRAGQAISIDMPSITFGRTTASDITLEWDPLVSSRHFEIARLEHGTFLRDLDSRNGSRINGLSVIQQVLRDGDVIEVGHCRLQVILAPMTSPSTPEQHFSPAQPHNAGNTTENSASQPHHHPAPPYPPRFSSKPDSGEPPAGDRKPLNPLESSIFLPTADGNYQSVDSHRENSRSNSEGLSAASAQALPTRDDALAVQSSPPSSGENAIIQVRLQIMSESADADDQSVAKLLWISPGQSLTFGRSPRCDCWWDGDRFLSSVHFKLTCQNNLCYIEDLQSSSGTWLNGIRVNRERIFHGDSILAGKTRLKVEVEGATGPIGRGASGISPIDAGEASLPLALPLPTPKSSKQLTEVGTPVSSVHICPSGLTALTGLDSQQFPQEVLIELLATLGKPFLLIDLSRCEGGIPEGVPAESSLLMRWLPDEVASRSPHLFQLHELAQWKEYARATSGKDGLVILLSESEKSSLLNQLQQLLRADPGTQGGNPTRGMLGFCWPSVMKACLESGADGFSDSLFKQVQLVMVETNDGAAHSIFAAKPDWIELIKQRLNLPDSVSD